MCRVQAFTLIKVQRKRSTCVCSLHRCAGQKVKDLRTWLTTYSYWNQGGLDNVVSMFLYLAKECFDVEGAQGEAAAPKPVVETPATGEGQEGSGGRGRGRGRDGGRKMGRRAELLAVGQDGHE
jgi:hypothetical protein